MTIICLEVWVTAFIKKQYIHRMTLKEISGVDFQHCLTFMGPCSINPSAWGLLKPSSYCDVRRFFYRVFKF